MTLMETSTRVHSLAALIPSLDGSDSVAMSRFDLQSASYLCILRSQKRAFRVRSDRNIAHYNLQSRCTGWLSIDLCTLHSEGGRRRHAHLRLPPLPRRRRSEFECSGVVGDEPGALVAGRVRRLCGALACNRVRVRTLPRCTTVALSALTFAGARFPTLRECSRSSGTYPSRSRSCRCALHTCAFSLTSPSKSRRPSVPTCCTCGACRSRSQSCSARRRRRALINGVKRARHSKRLRGEAAPRSPCEPSERSPLAPRRRPPCSATAPPRCATRTGRCKALIFTQKAAPKPAAAKPPSSVVDKGTHLAFTIQAKPGSKKSQISSIEEEFIGVNIGARPVDGEANDELLEYLGSVLQARSAFDSVAFLILALAGQEAAPLTQQSVVKEPSEGGSP